MSAVQTLPPFDPRLVPVVAVDTHLSAVPVDRLSAPALAQRFANPPQWEPEIVKERKFMQRDTAHAAVLIGLIERPEGLTVLLTQRANNLSTHSGQIAFPGGKTDKTDTNAAATALRETHEEVGLSSTYINVIGHLPLYTTGSSFIITPIVARVQPGFALSPNIQEVTSVFEVPLSFLMDPANHQHHTITWQNESREWLSMPYHDGDTEYFIWGATAAILRNLYRFLIA